MKAILVIDMPNKCNECPLFYDYLSCKANEDANIYGEERPYNCPLRPFDYKVGALGSVINPRGYTLSNADELLAEILGETE